jgi:hypothetical protein
VSGPASTVLPAAAIAHVVQTALAPVFMLTAIGALLNVFGTRLARVGDLADRLASGCARAFWTSR